MYTDDFENLCDQGTVIDIDPNIQSWLSGRDTILETLETNDRVNSHLHSILRSIHAIRFSAEWRNLSSQEKTAYRQTVFEKAHPDHRLYSQSLYRKKAKIFATRHDKVLKSRKDLRSLFLKVFPFFLLKKISA